MNDPNDHTTGETSPPRFTADGRHVITGHNDGRFRAPSTRILGALLIVVGILLAFSPSERWKSPYVVVAGVLVLVFARYVRHFMSPDSWYIAEDDRTD